MWLLLGAVRLSLQISLRVGKPTPLFGNNTDLSLFRRPAISIASISNSTMAMIKSALFNGGDELLRCIAQSQALIRYDIIDLWLNGSTMNA